MKTFLTTETMEQTKGWDDWDLKCMEISADCKKFNDQQEQKFKKREKAFKLLDKLVDMGYDGFGSEVWDWIVALSKPEPLKIPSDFYPPEPK